MLKNQITGSDLKIIAISTMVLDHIAAMYIFTDNLSLEGIPIIWAIIGIILRVIGRLSFTIICFLLIEGYMHTSNKIKYACRLFVLALLSDIPFNLFFFSTYFYLGYQNTIFTLLLGYLAVSCLDYFSKYENNKILFQIISVLVFSILAEVIRSDYGFFGVLFICSLYIFRKNQKYQFLISSIPLFFCGIGQIFGAFAFIPISKYNSKRGLNLKYIFYLFYPVHLILLYIIKININF